MSRLLDMLGHSSAFCAYDTAIFWNWISTQKITSKRKEEFIVALQNSGGSAGNRNLRKILNWEEEFYWKVQGKIIEDDKIVAGRGKGGSVS